MAMLLSKRSKKSTSISLDIPNLIYFILYKNTVLKNAINHTKPVLVRI